MLLRRPYKVRNSTPKYGKEITVPTDCPLEIGDKIVILTDGFLLAVPQGTEVDEEVLKKAIRLHGNQ